MSDVEFNTTEPIMLAQGGVCAHEGQVLISHPKIWPEYMVFSPRKARELADLLIHSATEAEGAPPVSNGELTPLQKVALYQNSGLSEVDSYKAVMAVQDTLIKELIGAGLRLAAENCNLVLAVPPEKRAALRPHDYERLSQQEQWDIDKRLGILDWDGKPIG